MKVFGRLGQILTWLLVAVSVAVTVFTVFSTTFVDEKNKSLFGYMPLTVLSDSMSATDFKSGDVIFIKGVNPDTLVEGDIVAFISHSGDSVGEIITHKIRSLVIDDSGRPAFITYGTTTGVDDSELVYFENVIGKYTFRLPSVGTFFLFLKTPVGYFSCIFTPLMALLVLHGIKTVKLFGKYKAEVREENEEAEKSRIKSLEEENERLRAQLNSVSTTDGI